MKHNIYHFRVLLHRMDYVENNLYDQQVNDPIGR